MSTRTPVEIARSVVATTLVGLAGAGFAVVFRLALHHGMVLLLGDSNVLTGFRGLGTGWRLAFPAVGGLLAGSVALLASQRVDGHGMAEILAALVLGRGELSLRAITWKALASWCAIVTGGSIGREGPIVQFGAGAGSLVGSRFGFPARQVRTLVAAGTAAGFAAAYNTPFAAILFVLEVFTGAVALDVVVPVAGASVIATYLTRLAVGRGPLYGARAFQLASDRELLAYIALGVLAGALGAGFMTGLKQVEQLFKKALPGRPVRAAVGGAIVGLLAVRLPEVTGNGYEAIQLILDGAASGLFLLVLLVAKTLATTSSVASGSPGGVFTPSLFLGAALGGLVGGVAPTLLGLPPGSSHAGAYALVGMGAMIASTTRAPLMGALLVFELSGDYAIVLPLLLATGSAALTSRRLRPHSIYAEEVRQRGLTWTGSMGEHLARTVQASDLMRPPQLVRSDLLLSHALELLEKAPGRSLYLASTPPRSLTWPQALQAAPTTPELTVADVATPAAFIHPSTLLPEMSERLAHPGVEELAVGRASNEGTLLGVVSREAVLEAYEREVLGREPSAEQIGESGRPLGRP